MDGLDGEVGGEGSGLRDGDGDGIDSTLHRSTKVRTYYVCLFLCLCLSVAMTYRALLYVFCFSHFSLFASFFGEGIGQAWWGMCGKEWNSSRPARSCTHTHLRGFYFTFSLGWAPQGGEESAGGMSGYLFCFFIFPADRPRMQGLVELGHLTCIHLHPWGGVFLFSWVWARVWILSGGLAGWAGLAGALIIPPAQEDMSCTERILNCKTCSIRLRGDNVLRAHAGSEK